MNQPKSTVEWHRDKEKSAQRQRVHHKSLTTVHRTAYTTKGEIEWEKKYTYYERGKSFVDDLHNENDSIK